jgi:phospholipid/cholesterol/gamma-HCH transport system substrate-binding protein
VVLAHNQEGLQSSLALLRPTTGLLQKYSPALTCLIQGLDTLNTLLSDVVGGTSPGLNINMSFTPAGGSYKSPRDLPEVRADNGPNCHGLPTLTPEEIPPPETHFDTGADPYPAEHNRPIVGGPPLAELLFGPVQPAEGEDR